MTSRSRKDYHRMTQTNKCLETPIYLCLSFKTNVYDKLKDDAICIIKDGIVQCRDHDVHTESSDASLKDVAGDIFNETIEKSKKKEDGGDFITKLIDFSSCWEKLTRLPIEQSDAIKKI